MRKWRQKDYRGQRWWMTPRKQCSPDIVQLTHIWTYRACDSMFHIHPSQTRSQLWEGEKGYKVLSLTKKPFEIIPAGKGNQVSPKVLTEYINHTPGKFPCPLNSCQQTPDNFLWVHFCFGITITILVLLTFFWVCFDFSFFWQRERYMKLNG